MLVIARKTNEKILIGGEIEITILKVDRNQVRIGIEAPKSISIVPIKSTVSREIVSNNDPRSDFDNLFKQGR